MKKNFVVVIAYFLVLTSSAMCQTRLLSISEKDRAKLPKEALEHVKRAEQLFAKAVYHLHLAEELAPGLSEGNKPNRIIRSRTPRLEPRRRMSRSRNRSNSKADEERRKLDKNYDRAKKGSKVLKWGLKVLSKIPVVKKFVPKGAGQAADAADKVGSKITAPKDGMANINGELKVWNKKKQRWEDF